MGDRVDPLTDHDGIGSKTADTIEEWWEHRFDREEAMPESSMEHTGTRSATLHLHNSWDEALEAADE